MAGTILHTPEGVRDICQQECRKKRKLEKMLHHVLKLYGYHDIQTPTFEFFDVFRKEIGTIPSRELYKFFDKDGETLVLRPDITPSIARAAATYFEEESMPVRLCYTGNTFVNRSSYQGRLKESTQSGAELIGIDSVEADAEMAAMAADCMLQCGLQEFQVNIGHVDFFQSLLNMAGFDGTTEEQVRELIGNRNYFGVLEILDEIHADEAVRNAFGVLPDLSGGIEVLDEARKIAPDSKALAALERLEEIYMILEQYGVSRYITFDLSMNGNYGYYSGVLFRVYTFGTGDAVVKGGRYDHLLEKFGKKAPSIGFAVITEELMNALVRQKIDISCPSDGTLIVYEESRISDAIAYVRELRKNGCKAELTKRQPQQAITDYEGFARKNDAGTLVYFPDGSGYKQTDLLSVKNAGGEV